MLKSFDNKINVYNFLLIVLVFIPKMDMISIGNYWQGIRVEDLILLLITLKLIKDKNDQILPGNYQFKDPFIIISYLLTANIVGHISGLSIYLMVMLRFIEYLILIIFLNKLTLSENFLKKLSLVYILTNVVFVILQEFDLIGVFSSLGYLGADHPINSRAIGITGGSWELGALSVLCFFIYFKFEKNKIKILLLYTITVALLILAESRGNFFAFMFVTFLFIIKEFLSNTKGIRIKVLAVFSITGLCYYFFPIINQLDLLVIRRMQGINILEIYELLKNFILYNDVPDAYGIQTWSQDLLSLIWRLNIWTKVYTEFNTNIFTQIFGTGMVRIYVDSLWIRVWLMTGYVGIFLTIYLSRKLNIFHLLFFMISGLTLDLFISFKIVLLSLLLYIKVDKTNENSN